MKFNLKYFDKKTLLFFERVEFDLTLNAPFNLNNCTLSHVNILEIQIAIFLIRNIICNKITYF